MSKELKKRKRELPGGTKQGSCRSLVALLEEDPIRNANCVPSLIRCLQTISFDVCDNSVSLRSTHACKTIQIWNWVWIVVSFRRLNFGFIYVNDYFMQEISAIHALQEYFMENFDKHHLRKISTHQNPVGSAVQNKLDGEDVFQKWLRRQYASCIWALLQLFSEKHDARVQISALATLMEFTRADESTGFDNELFFRIFAVVVTKEGVASEVLGAISEKYAQYEDIRYYILRAVTRICNKKALLPELGSVSNLEQNDEQKNPGNIGKDDSKDSSSDKEGEDDENNASPLHDIARNILDILLRIPFTQIWVEGEEGETLRSWSGLTEAGALQPANSAIGSRQRRLRRHDLEHVADVKSPEALKAKWANSKFSHRAYSDAWMAFLRLDLPDDAYRKALARLHDLVIPNLTSPLLLADFLTYSLDRGGLEGMLALNGIFLLVTKYGLEYPKFYERLYCLLDVDAFFSRHRLRFFQLTDIFLASGLVPAYTAAAFAKKFARLSLLVSPPGALICLSFIHNTIRRHPACLQILHRAPPGGVAGIATRSRKEGPVWQGDDVYDINEKDPSKSRALESSLWEITALRNHADPSVSSYCQILEKDLTDRRRTAEIDIEEILRLSYSSLFMKEIKRRLKSAPTAFHRDIPGRLFDPRNSNDFQGWK